MTSVTAEMEQDEKAVTDWNTEPTPCEQHLQFFHQVKNNQEDLKNKEVECVESLHTSASLS